MTELEVQVTRVVSVPFEENAYLVQLAGRDDCVVIDPGLEPEKIIEHLEATGCQPAAILNTHGHSDHIAGNEALKRRWPSCALVIGINEAAKLTDPKLNLSAMFGGCVVSPPADVTVQDGQAYSAAGLCWRIVEIPGHSAGHVVYLLEEHNPPLAFVGDVIFAGSIGRTDFPDGSLRELAAGIRTRVYTLPPQTVLLPGHGPPTTVGQEMRHNPYVSGKGVSP